MKIVKRLWSRRQWRLPLCYTSGRHRGACHSGAWVWRAAGSQADPEQWFGPVVTSSEKMSTTVNTLTSDVDASIDFVLEGHQHTCAVLSEPGNRYAMAQAVSLLAQARQVAILALAHPAFWLSTPRDCLAV